MAVSDNYGWAIILFRFHKGLDQLGIVRSHGDPRHINIPVAHCQHSQVFLGHRFTRGSKFCYTAQRRCFGHLPAGVGIYLGVQHQNIHIPP